jgi:hypothetical protein
LKDFTWFTNVSAKNKNAVGTAMTPIKVMYGEKSLMEMEIGSQMRAYEPAQIIIKNINRLRAKEPGTERRQAVKDAIPERMAEISRKDAKSPIWKCMKSQTCS